MLIMVCCFKKICGINQAEDRATWPNLLHRHTSALASFREWSVVSAWLRIQAQPWNPSQPRNSASASTCLQKSQRILPRFLYWESFTTSFAKIRNRKWDSPPTGNPMAEARHVRHLEFHSSFLPDFCMLMINGIRGNKIDIVRPKLRMLR